MRSTIWCFLAFISFSCISVSFLRCDNGGPTGPGPVTTELEGTWTGHMTMDTTAYSITFTQNSFSMTSGSGASMMVIYSGTFTSNPNTTPKQMDAYIA